MGIPPSGLFRLGAARWARTIRMIKRVLDVVLSTVSLIVLSPPLIVTALLIKQGDGGPVFYRGVRVGWHGKPFRIFKFRTMAVDAEKGGPSSTAADDPRITRIGKFIRRFNLDELPQFINVLKGEMSIVGPRPEVLRYVELFTDEERVILTVRPGITDWATLWIRDEGKILAESPDPDKTYMEKIRPEKLRLQLEYVRNHSLWIDVQIMLRTLKVHLLDRFKS